MANLDENRVRQIAQDVYNQLGTRWGIAKVPVHIHNGLDTNKIPFVGSLSDTPNTYAGAAGQVATVNATETGLIFSAGGGTPASPDTSVQFNDGGVFGGDSNLVWDKIDTKLILGETFEIYFNEINMVGVGLDMHANYFAIIANDTLEDGGSIYIAAGNNTVLFSGNGGDTQILGGNTAPIDTGIYAEGAQLTTGGATALHGGGLTMNGGDTNGLSEQAGGNVFIRGGDIKGGFGESGGVTIRGGDERSGGGGSFLGDVTIRSGLHVDGTPGGNVYLNDASIATSSTTGFIVIPRCAGTPTGSAVSGSMIYNTSANKLYIYNSGWKSVTLT